MRNERLKPSHDFLSELLAGAAIAQCRSFFAKNLSDKARTERRAGRL
jgi:hypothetical protein